jgi:hypothetical protein
MIHKLQFRLFLAFAIVILVAVGAVYLLVGQMAGNEVQRFGERNEQARFSRVEFELYRPSLQELEETRMLEKVEKPTDW